MTDLVFVDSNVVVYARDPTDAPKQSAAERWMRHLWESRTGCLSIQVINEVYNTLTRKLTPGLSRTEASSEVRALFAWNPLPLGTTVVDLAFAIEDPYQLAWWDSLIVAAAQQLDCRYLLSEDLHAGQVFGGVTVLDPFQVSPAELPG